MIEKNNNRTVGADYEKIVGSYLEDKGYTIVEYNYRCKLGEIDLIAKYQDTLVFCEVKYRKNVSKGHPLEAVGSKKRRIISNCAIWYITQHQIVNCSMRFDVIGILKDEIFHVEQAFDYVGDYK